MPQIKLANVMPSRNKNAGDTTAAGEHVSKHSAPGHDKAAHEKHNGGKKRSQEEASLEEADARLIADPDSADVVALLKDFGDRVVTPAGEDAPSPAAIIAFLGDLPPATLKRSEATKALARALVTAALPASNTFIGATVGSWGAAKLLDLESYHPILTRLGAKAGSMAVIVGAVEAAQGLYSRGHPRGLITKLLGDLEAGGVAPPATLLAWHAAATGAAFKGKEAVLKECAQWAEALTESESEFRAAAAAAEAEAETYEVEAKGRARAEKRRDENAAPEPEAPMIHIVCGQVAV